MRSGARVGADAGRGEGACAGDGEEEGGWKNVMSDTLARPSRMLVCLDLKLLEVAEESENAEGGGLLLSGSGSCCALLLTTSAERRDAEVKSRPWWPLFGFLSVWRELERERVRLRPSEAPVGTGLEVDLGEGDAKLRTDLSPFPTEADGCG